MSTSHQRRWTKFGFAGIAAAGALTLAACGGGPAGAGGGAAEDLEPLRVALITHQVPGDTFFDIMRAGAETAGERNNVEVLYTSDPEGPGQAQLISQAMEQGVDGIAVTLAKADAMSSAVQQAVDAGIPVFSINAGEEEYAEMGVLAHFGQNEYIAGESIGAQLNEEGAEQVVCVIQEQGHIGLESRCQGLADEFDGSSEVLYVNGQDMANVSSTITSSLQTNSDIDYVVTLGAPFAMTALGAIDEAGSDAQLGTVDLNADVYEAMQNGDIVFAVDQQPWMQGFASVEAVRLYHDGGYVLGGGQAVLTGPTVITQDNVDDVASQFEGGDASGSDEDEQAPDEEGEG